MKTTEDKNLYEDKLAQANEHLNGQKSLLIRTNHELKRLQGELTKQREKNTMNLQKLSDDKGKEITALFIDLEEKIKENNALEETVKKQLTSIHTIACMAATY